MKHDEAGPEQLSALAALQQTEVALLQVTGWSRRGGGWVRRNDVVPFTQEEAVGVQRRLLARAALINGTEKKDG